MDRFLSKVFLISFLIHCVGGSIWSCKEQEKQIEQLESDEGWWQIRCTICCTILIAVITCAGVIIFKFGGEKSDLQKQKRQLESDKSELQKQNGQVKTELENQKSELQKQIRKLEGEKSELQKQNGQVKTELEKQRDQLNRKRQEVETEIKKNKTDLQSVEEEIAKKETEFDKPEELLKDKENLLKSQWKLDDTKAGCNRQLINIDKLFEALENQVP